MHRVRLSAHRACWAGNLIQVPISVPVNVRGNGVSGCDRVRGALLPAHPRLPRPGRSPAFAAPGDTHSDRRGGGPRAPPPREQRNWRPESKHRHVTLDYDITARLASSHVRIRTTGGFPWCGAGLVPGRYGRWWAASPNGKRSGD
ncbi:chaplin family protein [Streptomyces zaehneri]|uniref:chaplin family protein n=1 Tax=Streptomyces zaehneri TaxID=3051180 RepID=UPI0037D9A561